MSELNHIGIEPKKTVVKKVYEIRKQLDVLCEDEMTNEQAIKLFWKLDELQEILNSLDE